MTNIFLKTLSSFYYDRIIVSITNDFIEMVNMRMRLEEAVREGRLTKEIGSSSNAKKFLSGFIKEKEQKVSVLLHGRQRRRYQPHHVVTVSPIINPPVVAPAYQPQFCQQPTQQSTQQHQQHQQQACPQFNNNNRV